MRVSVVVTQVEVDLLLRSLVPLRVDLSSEEEGTRVITVHEIHAVSLVAGRGARITGVASVEWPVLGITIPLKVDELSLDVIMRLDRTDDESVLKWNFAIGDVDLRYLPSFVEAPIVAKVNEALAGEGPTLSWAMGETLRQDFPLPAMLLPSRRYGIHLRAPHLELGADTITIAATIESAITIAQAPANETIA